MTRGVLFVIIFFSFHLFLATLTLFGWQKNDDIILPQNCIYPYGVTTLVTSAADEAESHSRCSTSFSGSHSRCSTSFSGSHSRCSTSFSGSHSRCSTSFSGSHSRCSTSFSGSHSRCSTSFSGSHLTSSVSSWGSIHTDHLFRQWHCIVLKLSLHSNVTAKENV